MSKFAHQNDFSPQGRAQLPADMIDLREVAGAMWRGKVWLVLGMIVGLFAGGYYAFFVATPLYKANALIEFAPQQNSVLDINSIVTGASTDSVTMNTEIQSIRMHETIGKLVDRTALVQDPQFNRALLGDDAKSLRQKIKDVLGLEELEIKRSDADQKAAERRSTIDLLRRAISVKTLTDTNILRITVEAQSPEIAAKLANTLAEIYIEDQLEAKFKAAQHSIEWLTDRARTLEEDVRQQEDEISALRASSDLTTSDELQSLTLQAKEFRTLLKSKEELLEKNEARLAAMRRLEEKPKKSEIVEVYDDLLLTRFAQNLSEDFSGSPQERNDALRRMLQLSEQLTRKVTLGKAEVEAIYGSLEKLQTRRETQVTELQTLRQKERKLKVKRDLYGTFLTGLQEATVQVGLVQADTRLASRARPPLGADSPNKTLIVAMSLVLGMMGGGLIVALINARGNGIRTVEELEEISPLPVLGEVPAVPIRNRSKLLKYVVENPTSEFSECIRNMRTSILQSTDTEDTTVIAFSSSVPGEGKSLISMSFASNIAGLNKKVLLIEGDIRRSVFSQYLPEQKHSHSIVDVVTGHVSLGEAAILNKKLGVDILFGSSSEKNPADLFSSESFAHFIAEARKLYDVIVIDTPPVLVVPDARIIAMQVDKFVYVAKWDVVTVGQIQKGLNMLGMANAPIAGFVLSQINAKKMKRYGYGAYAKYGGSYYGS